MGFADLEPRVQRDLLVLEREAERLGLRIRREGPWFGAEGCFRTDVRDVPLPVGTLGGTIMYDLKAPCPDLTVAHEMGHALGGWTDAGYVATRRLNWYSPTGIRLMLMDEERAWDIARTVLYRLGLLDRGGAVPRFEAERERCLKTYYRGDLAVELARWARAQRPRKR